MNVLIVDDEPGVAARLADELGAAGIADVHAATSAEEAVALLNRGDAPAGATDPAGDDGPAHSAHSAHSAHLDVLVTSVFLEELDGFTLHETLRPHLPDLRVIFLCAHDLAEYADRVGGWPVLAKPVEPGALAAQLHALVVETPPAPSEVDPLVGATLGNYRVEAAAGEDRDGRYYHAVQTSIGRPVELHVLAPERAGDPAEVARFLANARAKANVHHPALLSVFEAGEIGGWYFYASEARQGSSLAELAERRQVLDVPSLFQLLHTVAEAMVHLAQARTPHEPLRSGHVITDHRHRARLVNLATHAGAGSSARADMRRLADAVAPLVPAHPSSGSLRQLLSDLQAEAMTVRSWPALIYEVKRYSGGGAPAAQVDAGSRAGIEAVGAFRRRQRRRRTLVTVAVLLFLFAAAVAVWIFLGGEILSSIK